jgi:hypothetical protein
MARSLSTPWIKKQLAVLLDETNNISGGSSGSSGGGFGGGNKICQVICTYQRYRCVIISDGKHQIPLFLTPTATEKLEQEDNMAVSALKDGLIRIEKFHFSTVFHAAADRDLPTLINGLHGIDYPFVIQCSKLSYLGGNDITAIGNPASINAEAAGVLSAGFENVFNRLIRKQFPQEMSLPDCSK